MLAASFLAALGLAAYTTAQSPQSPEDKFRQLEESLPTPNAYRTASGAPGHEYWQQKVDYDIDVELDDESQRIVGSGKITYENNSPDTLRFLWLQLDQNMRAPHSDTELTRTFTGDQEKLALSLARRMMNDPFPGGYNISRVADAVGDPLDYVVVKTMMRVDLAEALSPGESTSFEIDWDYNIQNTKKLGGRSGAEFFKDDGNWLYGIAQWFPRLAAYNDVSGWQHKQFLGTGEFTLEFGDYKVRITAPDDHVVGSTGVLQNPEEVLKTEWRERLEQARTADKPVLIVTEEEATANEKTAPTGKKTWEFHAEKVRDFAFASSRKFIWDAQLHDVNGNEVMAMSYYPKEGNPLWEQYSTAAITHTLDIYSRYSFDYPYPTAISVNGPIGGGMEYPMICFNGPRPLKEDKTYSKRTKYGLISVIIHEVGHNYYPMIVNSDERQWTWMDEGLNSFVQYLAEVEWEDEYPSRRGDPAKMVEYMLSDRRDPIMTNSESVLSLGANAYGKPATALNILRETVIGRENFDFAFKEYSRRWMFKRPMPADFFRSMEDASGVDLDWFWRGWFYSNEFSDIAIQQVRELRVDTKNPEVENEIRRKEDEEEPMTLSEMRNAPLAKVVDAKPYLKDFYNEYDEFSVSEKDKEAFKKYMEDFEDEDKKFIDPDFLFYAVDLENIGGLVMPVILEVEWEDGEKEEIRIPAEIWRRNNIRVTKLLASTKPLKSIVLDPHWETADADINNNYFPTRPVKDTLEIYRDRKPVKINPMNEKRKYEEKRKKKELSEAEGDANKDAGVD